MSRAFEYRLVLRLNIARSWRIKEFVDSTKDVSDLVTTCLYASL
jgi:hypothetical protein